MVVNIKSHVSVVLDIVTPNYQEWRCFLDSVIGKFGLLSHIQAAPTATQLADPEWMMKDQCLVNWLFNTMSHDVMRIVRVPGASAFTIWSAVVDQFRDSTAPCTWRPNTGVCSKATSASPTAPPS
jgi:hypothetical protein